ncbi:MAG: DNA helicase RecQ, partial [Saprospiraceae bacterium]|nr:DNA helicase RecQ [Saprospiraceae bacterium]
QDSLVIMPTGGGKSLCYQLPAVVTDGLAVIISPLIALMADQVAALKSNNVAAEYINSSLSTAGKKEVFQDLEKGRIKLLYISPEKATMPKFIHYIRQKKISLVAIDEAHCVSIWGNDFRPVYAQLPNLLSALNDTAVMALTATADKATQQDICAKLKLKDAEVFLSSFERPNIHLEVRPARGRVQQIIQFVGQHRDQAGIIYCLSRKGTQLMAEKLRAAGVRAAHYHADMTTAERQKVQEAFQKDDLQIVCATIAFGMGIDKSNIRWVIHYNLPKNIESYYQEIGRSGRDGSDAKAILFYNYQDINVFHRFINESEAAEEFKLVQRSKLDRIWEFTQATNCRTNLILNYFGEYRSAACNHCDICTNPPKGFDGTAHAKIAIETCREAHERLTLPLMVDVLRASGRKEIFDLKLNELKTYGAGRDTSRFDWILYITQLINQGLLEIDYTQRSTLKLTSLSAEVSTGNTKVKLTKSNPQKNEPKQKTILLKNQNFDIQLFNLLKTWRKAQAQKEKYPAYLVLSDRVLEQIVTKRPTSLLDLSLISGIGEYKLKKYGKAIILHVQEFITGQKVLKNVKGKSPLDTLQLVREGKTPEHIAKLRQIKKETVYNHLMELFLKGEDIDLQAYITQPLLHEVIEAKKMSGDGHSAAEIAAYIKTPYPIYKIQIALAIIRRRKKETLM